MRKKVLIGLAVFALCLVGARSVRNAQRLQQQRAIDHEVEYMTVTGYISDWSLYKIGLTELQVMHVLHANGASQAVEMFHAADRPTRLLILQAAAEQARLEGGK